MPSCDCYQGFTFHDMGHTAKMIECKGGVDKNVRMVIFGHPNSNDKDRGYDTVDEGDGIDVMDKIETCLKNSHHGTKKSSQNREL